MRSEITRGRRIDSGKFVAVLGDTHGVPFCHLAHWWVKPRGEGVVELVEPRKSVLVAQMVQAEAFYCFGHGTWEGALRLSYTRQHGTVEYLTLDEVAELAEERKRSGVVRMRYAEIRTCYSARTAAGIATWLELAEEVRGFPDVTARWDCGILPMITFRHPPDHDPGPTDPATADERRT